MESVNRFQWGVTQEFEIPTLDDLDPVGLTDVRVVSLGLYDKTRHPDLVATDAGGRQLTVLDRQARGLLLGHAYLAKILKSGGPGGAHLRLPADQYDALLRVVAQVTALDERRADLSRRFWLTELDRLGGDLATVAQNEEFGNDLEHLGKEIHLLAYLPARPGEHVLVRHSFTEARRGVSLWSDFAGSAPAFSERVPTAAGRFIARWVWWIPFGCIRALLRLVGLLPFLIPMTNRNAEHVESLHIVLQAPDGLTIEDAFWEQLHEHDQPPPEERLNPVIAALKRFGRFLGRAVDKDSRQVAAEFRRGRAATISAHEDEVEVGAQRYWFGLQLAPSPLLLVGFVVVGLVSLVLAITSLLGSERCISTTECTPNSTGLGVMLALPGIAAGVLSQARSRVTARIGQGPRVLTLAAAVWPYAIAVLLAFEQATPRGLREWSKLGAAFAAFVAVLLLMIWGTPRHPFVTRLGREGGNGTMRKRWSRLRQFYAIVGLSVAIGSSVGVFRLIDWLASQP